MDPGTGKPRSVRTRIATRREPCGREQRLVAAAARRSLLAAMMAAE